MEPTRSFSRYAQLHPWIELLRLEGGEGRNFARKARAFNTGYEKLRDTPYDIVGNLDADLSFDEEFFAFLLERFVEMPELGVAGAPYPYGGVHYDYRFTDINDVSGCCQLFRRECLEEIGGYLPVEGGGIDWIAVATARLNGWKTRTFVERVAVHHRQMGSAGRRPWEVWFRRGEEDYALGGHPLWQLARSVYQSTSRPYVIGGAPPSFRLHLPVYQERGASGFARIGSASPGGAAAPIETGSRGCFAVGQPAAE